MRACVGIHFFPCHVIQLLQLHACFDCSDNPDTDIYGANLFNRDIQKKREKMQMRKLMAAAGSGSGGQSTTTAATSGADNMGWDGEVELNIDLLNSERTLTNIDTCESILVCTGVYSGTDDQLRLSGHSHRDFVMDAAMCRPSLTTVHNVEEAVRAVFEKEGINQLLLR